jgi:uroporphyrin-III C-methyltransferase/precorrin-2 dehydrogenase/sirohydrochlorin ferrochelatase
LRLEALLPADLGRHAEALYAARDKLRARWPEADDRRRALDAALAEKGPVDPFAASGEEHLAKWLADPAAPTGNGTIELTIASDDPDDLTLRQARLLGRADCVLFEPGIPAAILDRARADAVRRALPHDGPVPPGLTVILRRV